MPRNHSRSRDRSDCDKPRARTRDRNHIRSTAGMQKISVECEKEAADVIAQIRLEYGNKRQEEFKQKQKHQ
ncbi:hypothetical protein Tco_0668769 [Tanacetum coccineum]